MAMSIRDAIKAGYPQHAAIVFNDSMDIIGSERILLEDGFTLTQTYCSEENLKPGSIANDHIVVRMNNQDGALTGFDFARNAVLLLGVENDDPELVETLPNWSGTIVNSAMRINGVTVIQAEQPNPDPLYYNRFVAYKKDGASSWVTVGYALYMFSTYESAVGGGAVHAVYLVGKVSGAKKILDRFTIDEDGNVANTRPFTQTDISDYAWSRLDLLQSNGACEIIDDSINGSLQWTRFKLQGTDIYRTNVPYLVKSGFKGQQPRSTSEMVVEFTGTTDFETRLDQNADDYASAVWSSSKTLETILDEVLDEGSTWLLPENLRDVTFQSNPFAGYKGLTYREMFSFICEACGLIGKQVHAVGFSGYPTLQYQCYSHFIVTEHLSQGQSVATSLSTDEYYSYSKADYTVLPYDTLTWENLVPVSGAYIGSISVNDGGPTYVEYTIINNPIMDAKASTIIGKAHTNISGDYSGNYSPCNFETFLGTIINPGDTISLHMADGSIVKFPVFVVTINWNGGAECTVECTGVEKWNQNDDPAFRAAIQYANQAYRIADNVSPSSSSVNVKHDINRLTDSGDIVDTLRPVSFRYNFDPDNKKHYGLIYEEVADKYPMLVRPNPDDMKKRVNYQELIPVLLAEVQALRKRVKDLEQERNTGQN